MMKRTGILVVLLLTVVLTLAANGSAEPAGAEESGDKGKIEAVISYLEGSVAVDNIIADTGDIVPPGSKVSTGSNSFCEITFGSQNIFRVEENTITTIAISKDSKDIQVKKGAIDAIFDRLSVFGPADDEFRIRTPSMVAGIRGTVFYIKVEDPDTTYVCTCYGTVHQESLDGSTEQDVTAYHHKAYRYIRTESGVEIVPAGLDFHNDEAMDGLGEKINVTIPWGTPSE